MTKKPKPVSIKDLPVKMTEAEFEVFAAMGLLERQSCPSCKEEIWGEPGTSGSAICGDCNRPFQTNREGQVRTH